MRSRTVLGFSARRVMSRARRQSSRPMIEQIVEVAQASVHEVSHSSPWRLTVHCWALLPSVLISPSRSSLSKFSG